MTKRLKIKVPQIMAERGLDFLDLHYGAKIARATADRWTNDADNIEGIDIATIEAIARFLELPIEELIEFVEK